jgi:DnaJ-like protein
VRIHAAIGVLSLALLAATGCARKTGENPGNADSGQAKNVEAEIDLTAAQARVGTKAQVTIPETRQTVTVTIPPGVTDGAHLRLKGVGPPGYDGLPGDFVIKLRVK